MWTDSSIFSRPASPNAVQALSAPDSSWSTIDLSAHIPSDTKAIFVGGILIITHPHNALDLDPDILVGFRDFGDTWNQPYIGQSICPRDQTGWRAMLGMRTPFSCVVPVTNQRCQVKWGCIDSGVDNQRLVTPQNYPTNSSYAINLYVQGLWR